MSQEFSMTPAIIANPNKDLTIFPHQKKKTKKFKFNCQHRHAFAIKRTRIPIWHTKLRPLRQRWFVCCEPEPTQRPSSIPITVLLVLTQWQHRAGRALASNWARAAEINWQRATGNEPRPLDQMGHQRALRIASLTALKERTNSYLLCGYEENSKNLHRLTPTHISVKVCAIRKTCGEMCDGRRKERRIAVGQWRWRLYRTHAAIGHWKQPK